MLEFHSELFDNLLQFTAGFKGSKCTVECSLSGFVESLSIWWGGESDQK